MTAKRRHQRLLLTLNHRVVGQRCACNSGRRLRSLGPRYLQDYFCWCELFRHFTIDGVDPFEVRRRAGRCRTNTLAVLDLTDQHVREALDVDEQDLVGEDYQRCQRLANAARAAGLDGVLAPGAGLPGQQSLVVFTGPLDSGGVIIETERVQVPPISVVKLLPRVRAVPAAAAAFQAYTSDLARRPYAAVRRRNRGR